MQTGNQAYEVYHAAESRFDRGCATKVDEVVLALWDELEEKNKALRELSLKLSILETSEPVLEQLPTFAALMSRMAPKSDPAIAQVPA